jgi:cytochrome b561
MQVQTLQPDQPYARPQVLLHWLVFALVIVQWLSAGAMESYFDARNDAGPPGFPDVPLAMLHAGSGALILLLMLGRVVARLRYGAPPLPADVNPSIKALARANHYAFYGVLLLMAPTGMLALYADVDAADVHVLLKNLLIALVVLHLSGVAFHALIRRDGVVRRMLTTRRPG